MHLYEAYFLCRGLSYLAAAFISSESGSLSKFTVNFSLGSDLGTAHRDWLLTDYSKAPGHLHMY